MQEITATLKLTFSKEEEDVIDLQTNNVPLTLVLEHLSNLTKFLSRQILEDAAEFIPEKDIEKYLNARIQVDRETLNNLFK